MIPKERKKGKLFLEKMSENGFEFSCECINERPDFKEYFI